MVRQAHHERPRNPTPRCIGELEGARLMANETRTRKVGDPAPDFTLRATGNSTFTLSEHRGKNVVLVFFTAAFSGVCSQQMPQVQDSKTRFNDPDTVIAGISVDNSWSQGAWAKQMGIDFPLLSDFY